MFSKALFILSLISVAFATPYVTSPTNSTSASGGKTVLINWQDNGESPSLADFGPCKISLDVGTDKVQIPLQVFSDTVDVSKTSSISFPIDASVGPNGNSYFFRFESLNHKDDTPQKYPSLSFSSRFTLTDMTGTFSSSILAEISGQSTVPLVGSTSSGASSATASPSLTGSAASKTSSSTSKTTSATAKPSSGAMTLDAGWAGIVFGAVVGVAMF